MKKILVLGLGKFGNRVCKALAGRRSVRVYAFDVEERTVERLAPTVHTAGAGDLDDPEALKAFLAQVGDIDSAVISLGDNVNTSILAALQLREAGVANIVIKAVDPNHRRVLEAIDAGFPGDRHFQVLLPELDAADRLARTVASDFVTGELPLGSGLAIMEVTCPKELAGVPLKELDLRSRFHLTVIGYRARGESSESSDDRGDLKFASPDTALPEGGSIMIVGKQEDLEALERKFGKN
ncbi:MAG TPA: TrkA family potassium uptake protein [Planctomycetota bacterium]|nr:TrkA family potassium uptake protein [Planctomycetota bacterium]